MDSKKEDDASPSHSEMDSEKEDDASPSHSEMDSEKEDDASPSHNEMDSEKEDDASPSHNEMDSEKEDDASPSHNEMDSENEGGASVYLLVDGVIIAAYLFEDYMRMRQQESTSYPQSSAGFQLDSAVLGAPPPFFTAGQQCQYQPTSSDQTMQSIVVVSQPEEFTGPLAMPVPKNHKHLAWFTCLCCSCPLGIAAILQSNKVDIAVERGDLDAAERASRHSRQISLWGIVLGSALFIVFILAALGFFRKDQ